MQRWNGWGECSISLEVPPPILNFLVKKMGHGRVPKSVSLESVLEHIPKTRLAHTPSFLITEAPSRLKHAHGQSFPDWLALRTGTLPAFPDAVAYPTSEEDIRSLLKWALSNRVTLIPFGGGTSVVGHINPQPESENPICSVDMGNLRKVLQLQPENNLAYVGAGARGPDLESQLAHEGYTLGHFPQSFECSTLGGWIMTHSSGQQSYYYGRIEQMFRGGHIETPRGALDIPPFPASATGLDLREMVLGSEGRIGILTAAYVSVKPVPEKETFYAACFPSFRHGVRALQQLSHVKMAISMLRLANREETQTFFKWASVKAPFATKILEYYSSCRGLGPEKTLLLFALTGKPNLIRMTEKEVSREVRREDGVWLGSPVGEAWKRDRFQQPYLRNALWELGFGVDTLETATTWDHCVPLMEAIEKNIAQASRKLGGRVHVMSHISHVYATGCSLYTTVLFRLAHPVEETLWRWKVVKDTACETILKNYGTISHQHGVGTDHAPYLSKEKGILGIGAMQTLIQHFDPNGIMNPGKLVPCKNLSL